MGHPRVQQFQTLKVEHNEVLADMGEQFEQHWQEELVLTAWRAGYYFDRPIEITRRPESLLSRPDEPIHHTRIHLYALGLALPSPEQD